MGEDLLACAGGRSKGPKWSGKGLAVHVLDVPDAAALDAPTDLHVTCCGNESVAPGFKPTQCD
jgi:hypothetical protein